MSIFQKKKKKRERMSWFIDNILCGYCNLKVINKRRGNLPPPFPSKEREREGALFDYLPLLLYVPLVFYLATSTCKPFKGTFLLVCLLFHVLRNLI